MSRVRESCALALAALTVGVACSSPPTAAVGSQCDPAPYDDAIAAVTAHGVIGMGPHGESPESADSIQLSDHEIASVRGRNATAAIVLHFSGDSWSTAQVGGLKSEFDRLGISVVAQSDAQADPAKQFSDIETAVAARPDVIVSIPSLDPAALAPAYQKAVSSGIKLVFMENPATNFRPGSDYVSVVATDNYGAGVVNAHQMAKALCGRGSVGVLFHAARVPTNELRERGFVETIERDYPDIDIVGRKGLLGPNWNVEAGLAVNAWLTKHPDLGGVWCWFDAPCEGAIDAARSSGRDRLAVTSIDLGNNVAIDMARGAFVSGIAAAQPYLQGIVEARLAGYALIGKVAPPFVEVPALPVDRHNLTDAWRTVYRTEPPVDVQKALGAY
ncbi:sugar ABC transporter substrate-binding protein [Mycobacterium sp. 852013-50091_SCH5140682]|nr:sugar ABC transporter substrate-binding protein [Mycobacterium sp. 852013-50091_SCH5140682]